jgi:hypothetical protein
MLSITSDDFTVKNCNFADFLREKIKRLWVLHPEKGGKGAESP